ncbi:MAG: hypothetical protein ACOYNS_13780 [Bacteroidota bacterium]
MLGFSSHEVIPLGLATHPAARYTINGISLMENIPRLKVPRLSLIDFESGRDSRGKAMPSASGVHNKSCCKAGFVVLNRMSLLLVLK